MPPSNSAASPASVGIALCPDDSSDRDRRCSLAPTPRSTAPSPKAARHSASSNLTMGEAVRDRRLLEHDLRNAIDANQLKVVYQPQGTMESGACDRLRGTAALEPSASRGNIRPDIFIPIAEDTGAILGIGEWVLRAACREAATWKHPLTIAVNVSAVQIHHDSFVATVHEVLLETGLPPHRLELEITETALIRDFDRALSDTPPDQGARRSHRHG